MRVGVVKALRPVRGHWWLWLPVLLAMAFMAPRIASAQFSLFDDGETAETAARIANGSAAFFAPSASGRFQPGYQIYSAGLFYLFNNHPKPVYFIHGLLLAAIVGLTALLVHRWGGNSLQTFLSALLVTSAGATVENFYTLSKSETLLAVFILAGLCLISTLPERKTRLSKGLTIAGSTALFIAAALTKETFVIMPLIGLVWLMIPYVFRFVKSSLAETNTRKAVFLALLAALAIFLAASYSSLTVDVPGKYSSRFVLSLARVLESMAQWRNWLMRDYFYLLPAFLLWLSLFLLNRSDSSLRLGLDALVFCVAWFLIYLPWEFVQEYYLLLFALGGVTLTGLALGKLPFVWRNLQKGWRIATALLAAATVYFWLTTLPTQVNKAQLLLTVDRINSDMLAYLADELPPNSQVMVNMVPGSEYIAEMKLHLKNFFHRPDIDVQPFEYQLPQTGEELRYWLVAPQVTNKPIYSVRFGFLEIQQQRANALLSDFAPKIDASFIGGYEQWQVKPFRPACWLLTAVGACAADEKWISSSRLDYRWTVNLFESGGRLRDTPATYSPADGRWQVKEENGGLLEVQFGCEGCQPLAGDIDGEGFSDLALYDPASKQWMFDTNLDGEAERNFTLPEAHSGDVPLLGDWDGDGRSSPGFFSPGSQTWSFFDEEGRVQLTLQAGKAGDMPVTGDWNGDGRDTIGVYRPATGEVDLENELIGPLTGVDYFGPVDSLPVAGRWSGLRAETLTFFVNGTWRPYFWTHDGEPLTQPAPFVMGSAGDYPLAGNWK
jgi:hypothetical protein